MIIYCLRVVLVARTSNDLFSKTYNAHRKSLSYASMEKIKAALSHSQQKMDVAVLFAMAGN
jgi:hypothetical protein